MINKRKFLKEGYGNGFSMSSGTISGMGGSSRGGFGGASNMGGPNSMYVYEIKPLNHTLEQKPSDTNQNSYKIQIGSRISGYQVKSNNVIGDKEIIGVLQKIVKNDENLIKYYIVLDEVTQQLVKINPTTAKLIYHEPLEYQYDAYNTYSSKRKEKIKKYNKKLVKESLYEKSPNKYE